MTDPTETATPPPIAQPVGFNITEAMPIVLAGAATLLFELVMIRYIPGQVRILGYFTNFVLLAAFLGMGVGMMAVRRWPGARTWPWLAPISLFLVVALTALGEKLHVIPTTEQFLFVGYTTPGKAIAFYPFLLISFVILALSMVPLGCFVGITLEGDRPLYRYGLNILGSLIGIALFALLLGLAPWVWVVAAGILSAVPALQASMPWRIGSALVILATGILTWNATSGSIWSPYQKITVAPIYILRGGGIVPEWRLTDLTTAQRENLVELPESSGFTLRVNDETYQTPVDVSDASLAKYPELRPMRVQYDLPFMIGLPHKDILVLGAGTGNDVAGALRNGALHVDAVEIDPKILELAKKHPEHPYNDPRVEVHLDDARNFLSRTNKLYDIIIFGMLDSHVLFSSKSNVRLDSFVFTEESFELAKKHLSPRGGLFLSHAVGTDWFIQRMQATLAEAFDKPPFMLNSRIAHPFGIVYVDGATVLRGPEVPRSTPILEDDWPFPYLQGRHVPIEYWITILIIALVSLAAVYLTAGREWRGGVDWHFFSLGAGFLLLETRGLTVLALLLGSTWKVNSAVFAGVLVMALLSTFMGAALSRSGKLPWGIYLLLWGLISLNLLVPVGTLLSLPRAAATLSGVAFVCLPLFASGTIFSTSLARAGSADLALASNLVGAVVGGLLENSSMVFGFHWLLVLAAAIYGVTLLTDIRAREIG